MIDVDNSLDMGGGSSLQFCKFKYLISSKFPQKDPIKNTDLTKFSPNLDCFLVNAVSFLDLDNYLLL